MATTTIKIYIFSSKILAAFITVGPLVAFFGAGGTFRDISGSPLLLAVYYIPGVMFAFIAWLIYSSIFKLISHVISADKYTLYFYSAILGGISGYIAWSIPTCINSGWVVGGFVSCMKISIYRDYGISLFPGFLSGLVCNLLLSKDNE